MAENANEETEKKMSRRDTALQLAQCIESTVFMQDEANK